MIVSGDGVMNFHILKISKRLLGEIFQIASNLWTERLWLKFLPVLIVEEITNLSPEKWISIKRSQLLYLVAAHNADIFYASAAKTQPASGNALALTAQKKFKPPMLRSAWK